MDLVAMTGDPDTGADSLVATFSSDLDGQLWTGTPDSSGAIGQSTATLSGGAHRITFEVTDPRGEFETCGASITVDPCLDQDLDGQTSCAGDCNDTDELTFTGAAELADYRDNDCDGVVDEGTVNFDDDGDGYTELDGDCDDADSDIHPGATETGYDGIDQDCSGADGIDMDADGWAALVAGGLDCDDDDPSIHPSATEIWYDGVDQDCDGASDFDADGDGWDSDLWGGADCDDTLDRVSPSEIEIWYDGVDSDCDGADDNDADGDGYDSADHGGLDCDDTLLMVHPGAPEIRNAKDDDCDNECDEGLLVEGDLVITEIMKDPNQVSDAMGEWFEVYNPGTIDVRMCGWKISDADTDAFTMSSEVLVPAGGYAVFGRSNDKANNGGLTVDYAYSSGMQLANGADELVLTQGSTEIDRVEYDDGSTFPDPTGASLSLDPSKLDAASNDSGSSWCTASSTFGSGDRGTPGAANDGC